MTTYRATVRPADSGDVADIAQMLAAAFDDDPFVGWLLPERRSRPARATRMFATLTEHHLRRGRVEVAVDERGRALGATLWSPPNRWRHTVSDQLQMLPGMMRAFGTRLPFLARADAQIQRVHPEEPHWYLQTIGTIPTARGTGHGQALLHSQLQRCDTEHAPAYLESSKPDNVSYYQRFGFTVTDEIVMAPDGPPITLMWRPPR